MDNSTPDQETPAPLPTPPAQMSGRRWTMLILGVLIFCMFWVVATTSSNKKRLAVPASQLPQRNVPAFSLTATDGRQVSHEQMLGRPTLYYFFFSTCPGICPVMNQNAAKLRDSLPADSRLRIVGISVLPEVDTPEVLQRYGTRFQVDPARWLMLTGDRQQIFKLAQEGFKLPAMEADAANIPTTGPVIHSERFVLVDKTGSIIGYFDGLAEDFPQQVTQAMKLNSVE